MTNVSSDNYANNYATNRLLRKIQVKTGDLSDKGNPSKCKTREDFQTPTPSMPASRASIAPASPPTLCNSSPVVGVPLLVGLLVVSHDSFQSSYAGLPMSLYEGAGLWSGRVSYVVHILRYMKVISLPKRRSMPLQSGLRDRQASRDDQVGIVTGVLMRAEGLTPGKSISVGLRSF
jgi:hypothetical protein